LPLVISFQVSIIFPSLARLTISAKPERSFAECL
jgi:hypothetical protein